MHDSRGFLARVWGLAEDLAVQQGTPLHAFLLLHHVLTHPPAVLRGASGVSNNNNNTAAAAAATASTSTAELPLHATAFDAEWKCEELVTRLRAAEYLLYADVPAVGQRESSPTASPASPLRPAAATAASSRPASTHTLSRAAGLEALELAEQVLAPVFASSSLSCAPDAAPAHAAPPPPPPPSHQPPPHTHGTAAWQHHRSARYGSGSARDGASAAGYSLDDVVREVADVSRKSSALAGVPPSTSAAAMYRRGNATVGGNSNNVDPQSATDAVDGAGVRARGAGMYFLNPAAVAALAWPRMPFVVTWPVPSDGSHHHDHKDNNGTSAIAKTTLRCGAASETITIAVGLVVRAHVLQATVCHRRQQHKRALQCLAEARRWLTQQFGDAAARTRSVRLLWEDLQLRCLPATPVGGAAPPTPSTSSAPLQLSALPGFEAVMTRLIEEEARACATMLQVEECKVHFSILQSCGSLPPPTPLLLPGGAAASAATPAPDAFSPLSHTGVKGTATTAAAVSQTPEGPAPSLPTHGHDLRQHYRRYQESVQELVSASRAYMTVVQWIGEEDEGRGDPDVRGAVDEDADAAKHASTAVDLRAQLRQVRRQLSPFCLCALHEVVRHDTGRAYAAGFDMRLAAEVLGILHSLSQVYLLYQPPTSATATASPSSSRGPSAVERIAALQHDARKPAPSPSRGTADIERDFVQQYRRDAAYRAFVGEAASRPLAQAGVPPPDTDADVIAATLRDPVRRALEHARLCAFIFGRRDGPSAAAAAAGAAGLAERVPLDPPSPPSASNTVAGYVKRIKMEAPPADSASSRPCWRVGGAADAADGGGAVHEAVLLWGMMEMGLCDNVALVLRLQREFGHATPTSTEPPHTSPSPVKREAESPTLRKRRYSQDEADVASPSALQPPVSWSWVLPGVRRVLQLYVELCTALMQVAATTTTTNPASTLAAAPSHAAGANGASHGAAVAATPNPVLPPTAGGVAVPAIPILRTGLPHAERLMARLLFTLDAEMLKLTGNTWGIAGGSTSPTLTGDTADGRASGSGHSRPRGGRTESPPSGVSAAASYFSVDQLQCAAPVQLRCLVHVKAAALLTMARCHLTQLSVLRAVHYLREAQQFTRVFHRQARQTLLPEMHLLLACVATCLSVRRLPPPPGGRTGRQPRLAFPQQQQQQQLVGPAHEMDAPAAGARDGDEQQQQRQGDSDVVDALSALARGWAAVDDTDATAASSSPGLDDFSAALGHNNSSSSSHHYSHGHDPSSNPPHERAFAISPQEEAALAHDVGLPYLHLLAAERAACTTLHTPPSLLLLVYLLKAWAVLQLVHGGEELVWAEAAAHRSPTASPLPASAAPPRSPLPCTHASVTGSPPCPPLPSPSHATTTLNSTVEDQQRRVARLESLTTTPTSTPTLRSRHAALPMEMQRIQLEPAVTGVGAAATRSGSGSGSGDDGGGGGGAPEESLKAAHSERHGAPADGVGGGSSGGSRSNAAKSVVKQETEWDAANAAAAAAAAVRPTTPRPCVPSPPPPAPPSGAHTKTVPPSQRHRGRAALQRMLDVLLHHYDAHHTRPAVKAVAWTPLNVVLLRLLRGATLLYTDKDEPAAARELKAATHYAKQHLGVLHPHVADGMALLANAYASLDVDAACGKAGGVSPVSPVDGGAARTRRVAEQLALRCSCAALASLALAGAAGGAAASWGSGDGAPGASDPANAAAPAATAVPPSSAALASAGLRLREWWASQVLHDLCGNSCTASGAPAGHRGAAVQQLRRVLGWLPGTAEYCFP